MTENPQITKPKSISKVLIVLVLLLTACVSAMGVFIWSMTKQHELENKITMLESHAISKEKLDKVEGDVLKDAPMKSSLEDIDGTWQKYTNHEYGYSLNIPKEAYSYTGACKWKDDDDHSYRPEGALVPVTALDGPEGTYIALEYRYALSGETVENNRHYFSDCNLVENTYARLTSESVVHTWKIVTEDIVDESELEEFIQDRYGGGCALGDQIVTEQEGVFDVRVEGDGLDLDETQCPLNFMTVLKYYPAKNKVVSWHMGQAISFYDESASDGYDMEMLESFRFE